MKIKTLLTISRPSCSNGEKMIRIGVTDDSSRAKFLEIEIGLAEFAECLTGLSYIECKGDVRGLDVVGKTKICEKRSIECPLDTYDRKLLEEWLEENAQEHYWKVNSSLSSQGSVDRANGKTVLNYSVTRYE